MSGRVAPFMNGNDEESRMVKTGDQVKLVVELVVPVACKRGKRFAVRGGKTWSWCYSVYHQVIYLGAFCVQCALAFLANLLKCQHSYCGAQFIFLPGDDDL